MLVTKYVPLWAIFTVSFMGTTDAALYNKAGGMSSFANILEPSVFSVVISNNVLMSNIDNPNPNPDARDSNSTATIEEMNEDPMIPVTQKETIRSSLSLRLTSILTLALTVTLTLALTFTQTLDL